MTALLFEILEYLVLRRSLPIRAKAAAFIPNWFFKGLQQDRFGHMLRYVAKRSPFYRDRFKKLDLNVKKIDHPSQMGNFFTTSEDLRNYPTEYFLCDRPQMGFETTGTISSKGKRIYFSNKEIIDMGRDGAVGFYSLGLRPEDRVVDAFDYSFWNAPIAFLASVTPVGCFHIIGAKLPPEEFYDRIRDYNFNVIAGQPSWLTCLTEVAEKKGAWPLKFIFAGGESMTEETRKYIEGVWHTNVYLSYGQTEAFGALGVECPSKNGYHINEVVIFPEIINPDSEGYGELVYTTLYRDVMPFIRYRSSDITRIIEEPCDCPMRSLRRLAKIRGRCDEMVNCGMGNISPWFIEEILKGVRGILSDWQVAVTRLGNKDAIEFRLELQNGASPADIEAQIRHNMIERQAEAWRDYELGLYTMSFSFHPRGSLRGDRKLRRVVDNREMYKK